MKMARVINCGSLNIDHVYKVPDIVRPGETISSKAYEIHCGGKGANQSVALARSGLAVRHVGRIGGDGFLLRETLSKSGVDISFISVGEEPTGHALIQVAESGENSIVLFPGANHKITEAELCAAFDSALPEDILLLQNETNINSFAIEKAFERGMKICLNPAPFDDSIKELPLEKLSMLIVNETEGEALSGVSGADNVIRELSGLWPGIEVVMTLGKEGAVYSFGGNTIKADGLRIKAVDTTAAGDTFIGYFLAGKILGFDVGKALRLGCAAAALSVGRKGAMDSIPYMNEVNVY